MTEEIKNEEKYIELIEAKELMSLILEVIDTGEVDKLLKAYEHGNEQLFKDGYVAGLAMAGMMTGKCNQYKALKLHEEEK